MNQNKHNQDDDSDIVVTPVGVLNYHRLYERYLFFYVLILSGLLFFGAWLFSRRMDGFSAEETLAWHFINYILVVGLMVMTPVWYALFLQWLPETDRIWRDIRRALNSIPDEEERTQVARVLYVNGEWPPSIPQMAALIVIFAILLWEIWFLSCWVDADGVLVWQPDWVQAVIRWMRENMGFYGEGKLFSAGIGRDEIEIMTAAGYPQIKDADFFNTPLGHSVLFFHAWRVISYPIVLLCSGVVLWRSLDWLGMERMNPRNIHGVGRFIWCSILSPFVLVFLVAGASLPILAPASLSLFSIVPELWVANLKFYIFGAFFFHLALKFFWGWLQFWKRVFKL